MKQWTVFTAAKEEENRNGTAPGGGEREKGKEKRGKSHLRYNKLPKAKKKRGGREKSVQKEWE